MATSRKEEAITDTCVRLYGDYFASYSQEYSEQEAQKRAISKSLVEALEKFGVERSSELWKAIQSAHVKRKSGALIDAEVIQKVSSANQSWNKSSGHAFEESFCNLVNEKLGHTDIKFLLQREVTEAISLGNLENKARDKETIDSWLGSSAFDVYSAMANKDNEKITIFGCVQCKTSIRDRVTRDREPSLQAMNANFWSIAVVLDGGFLKLPKFNSMVNGGSSDYKTNGWHGMYSFSNCEQRERISLLNDEFEPLILSTLKAANQWLEERQWLDADWQVDDAS